MYKGNVKGRIFDIQRFSIHDGPGIRTNVFMKGCPLRCLWCHNPESISPDPVLSFLPDRCIGCGYCFRVCPNEAHRMDPERGHTLDRGRCKVCGLCAKECYAGALELIGRDATVDEVIAEVLRDKSFYETSGGGMTLSGGEPMMQIDFAEAILKRAKEEELHCCVETCGFCNFSLFERIFDYVDLFIYDIKDIDESRHRDFTGVSNGPILRNVKALHDRKARILIRLPIIPGYNDRDDHFEGVAALFRGLPKIEGVEIIPYHRLGASKADRLGIDPKTRERSHPPDQKTVDVWIACLEELSVRVINRKSESSIASGSNDAFLMGSRD
ncbi:MAG: glycyl-radical enzyme activating protein [bacterium]